MKAWCCKIDCENDATKEIYFEPDTGVAEHDSYTHSCDCHVSDLSDGLKVIEIVSMK